MTLEVPPQAAKDSSDPLDFISALSPHSCTTSYVLRALFSSVQFSSVAQLCLTLCDPMDCGMPGLPVHHQLLESMSPNLMSMESVMPSNHLILCHPLLLPPSIFPNIRVFSNESVLHIRWPKGSFSSWKYSCKKTQQRLCPPELCSVEEPDLHQTHG